MDFCLARQPIFDNNKEIVAYELLYRKGEENSFPVGVEPHQATLKLVKAIRACSSLSIVTEGKPAFINFTEQCILANFPESLPNESIVVEALESIDPNDKMLHSFQTLFEKGYIIALDDFDYSTSWERFFNFVKIVKFDIQKTPLSGVADALLKLSEHGEIKLLAERIETKQEFEEAKAMNFDFYQGFFLSHPEMIKISGDVVVPLNNQPETKR